MSVILDALKRVQDEGRGRDRAAGSVRRDTQSHGDSMLRRLAGGAEPPTSTAGPRSPLSPSVRIALLVLGLAVIVVGALWVFQPSLGTAPGNASPLLTGLTGAGQRQALPAEERTTPPAAPQPRVQTMFEDLVAAAPPPIEPSEPVAEQTAPAAQDYRDLSGNLEDSSADWNAEPTAAAPASGAGYLDLTSSFSAPEPEGSDARVDVAAARSETARLPRELVDPGVRAAFAEGVRLQRLGDVSGAQAAYERALKFDPYNAKVNANLGVLYESTDRFQLAERHLRQAVAIEPNNANAHNNLGVVLYRMGSYESALAEFNRTSTLDPDRLDAYINKGLIFTRWGRYEDAESAFLQVLARDGSNALAHYNLGLVYEETDQIERALNQYHEFLAIGASEYREIAQYLADHLPWLEARLDAGSKRSR